jgi:hypothetical protein
VVLRELGTVTCRVSQWIPDEHVDLIAMLSEGQQPHRLRRWPSIVLPRHSCQRYGGCGRADRSSGERCLEHPAPCGVAGWRDAFIDGACH